MRAIDEDWLNPIESAKQIKIIAKEIKYSSSTTKNPYKVSGISINIMRHWDLQWKQYQ